MMGWYASGPNTAFMVPQAEWLSEEEAEAYVEIYATEGWYSRLTAPGYLDSTEWSGPFPNLFRAVRHLLDMFDIDLDGNPRE